MRKMIALQTFFIAVAVALYGCGSRSSDEASAPRDVSAQPTQQASPAPVSAQQSDPFASVPRISVEDLSKALKDGRAVAVDVRPAEAFEEEHVAGAFSMPEEEVRERADELPRGKLVVTYCA